VIDTLPLLVCVFLVQTDLLEEDEEEVVITELEFV
jgi:hypothetical protein